MEPFVLSKALKNVRKKTPLVHCITNYVTVNDCANALLACGGSPIMSDEPKDVGDIQTICGGLVLNIGTLNARTIESFLDEGIDVACPVLGDPSIYSTYGYLRAALVADGYEASMVSGVPSFCAAAAELGMSLVEGDECLQVVPVRRGLQPELFSGPGSYVLMKVGSCLQDVKDCLSAAGLEACAVERCGMEDERVYRGADRIPDEADYLTLVIARPPQ